MIPLSVSGVRGTLVITVSTALLAAAAAGCERAPPAPEGPITTEVYAAVMGELADLKRFPPPGSDYVTRAARADSARQAILDRHGVAVDELLAYAEQLGSDPERMLDASDRIIVISDSLARQHRSPSADSTAADTASLDAAFPDATGSARPADADTALRRLELDRLRQRLGARKVSP